MSLHVNCLFNIVLNTGGVTRSVDELGGLVDRLSGLVDRLFLFSFFI